MLRISSNKPLRWAKMLSVAMLVIMTILIGPSCKQEPFVLTTPEPPTIQFPMDDYENKLFQDFAAFNLWDNDKYHSAEDVVDSAGAPIYAMTDGIIRYSGYMYGYGWLIVIDHPDYQVYTLYGHLSTRRWKMTEGLVESGELIGYVGDEDENTGGDYEVVTHLHFGVRDGFQDQYPLFGDDRWMAGYTFAHPATLGWLDPTDYINAVPDQQE